MSRFGWVNASYVYGLTLVSAHMRRALGACISWDTYVKATEALGSDDDDDDHDEHDDHDHDHDFA